MAISVTQLPRGRCAGMPYGYLGIGLDVYGNYENTPLAGGSGCTIPSPLVSSKAYPESVTARGPGIGTVGYCILGTTATTYNKSDGGGSSNGRSPISAPATCSTSQSATSRIGDMVPVEMAINPSAAATTTTSGLSVPAMSWLIAYTPLGTTTQQTLTGALPTTTQQRRARNLPLVMDQPRDRHPLPAHLRMDGIDRWCERVSRGQSADRIDADRRRA